MDDPQARLSEKERDELAKRIQQAADAGRIGAADRDIRLGNVRSAQSRNELDLMRRELDQLDAALPSPSGAPSASPTPGTPYGAFDPDPDASHPSGAGVTANGSQRTWVLTAVIAGIALLLAGGVGVAGLIGHRSSSSSTPRALPPAQTDDASPSDVGDPTTGTGTAGYALNAQGISAFLATYAKKFGTTQVVDLVMYPDYVVVDVPVAGGGGRQAGWLYREQSGWTTFGGERAVFPGSATVDLLRLDVEALVRNIARARATLKVEKPTQTYVVVRFVPGTDRVPRVDIHVANGFNESGYLATRLNGTVERSYVFGG